MRTLNTHAVHEQLPRGDGTQRLPHTNTAEVPEHHSGQQNTASCRSSRTRPREATNACRERRPNREKERHQRARKHNGERIDRRGENTVLRHDSRRERQRESAMGRDQRAKHLKNDRRNEGSALAYNQPGHHHNHRDGAGQSMRGRNIQQVRNDFPPGEAAPVPQRRDNPRERGQKRGKRIHPDDHAC